MEVVPVVGAGVVHQVLAVRNLPDGPLHLEVRLLKAEPPVRLGREAGDVPVPHVCIEGFVDGIELVAEAIEVKVIVRQGREAQHSELEPVEEIEIILLHDPT